MSINFPNAPTPGQVFTAQGRDFIWTGEVWLLQPQSFPWASNEDALAGVAADRVLSPATAKLRVNQIAPGGGPHPFSGTPTALLASRVPNTTIYQNTDAKPRLLSVWGVSANLYVEMGAVSDTIQLFAFTTFWTAGAPSYLLSLIPPKWFYRVLVRNGSGTPDASLLQGWTEYL